MYDFVGDICNVDDYDRTGYCPLHYASQNGHYDIVELLIICGCDVDIQTKDGLTGFMLAAKNNHTKTMKIFFKYAANLLIVSRSGSTICHYAAQQDCYNSIILLNKLYYELKFCIKKIIIINNNNEMMTNNNSNNQSSKEISMIEDESLLMSEEFSFLENYLSVLIKDNKFDLYNNYIQTLTIQNILDSANPGGYHPLHLAAENDCLLAVKAFMEIKQSINFNAKDSTGETALHKAARNKHFIMYRLLISAGSLDNIMSNVRQTPKQLLVDDYN